MEGYRADTLATLERLKHESAVTLAAGAMLAMVVQTGIDWYEGSPDYRVLTWMVFAGSLASLVATGLWWKSGKRSMMLTASVIFQAAAMVYAFSVFAASMPLMELAGHGRTGQYVVWGIVLVAVSPLGLSLLAWHQYRNYVKVLKA